VGHRIDVCRWAICDLIPCRGNHRPLLAKPSSPLLEAARRPRVANRAAINCQRQLTNGKLLRSRHAFLVLPSAPRMLAAIDLAKTEHAHPLGAAAPDNFATHFDLGGQSSTSLDDTADLKTMLDWDHRPKRGR
jgi:hypothetical protein